MLTIAKAAKLLGISSDDVKELLLDPELPRLIFNRGRVRLPRRGLLDYIKRRTQNWYD
ncbi:helix-turn-helix domain-containing protein [Levilactobacillus sp. HBUAS70063]|uniref:helix-turn-helix domain-containing protein n=1 Tax=Levilactobacillus sp. HBUAS70063 TaxID=3109359 RepID=UPI003133117F